MELTATVLIRASRGKPLDLLAHVQGAGVEEIPVRLRMTIFNLCNDIDVESHSRLFEPVASNACAQTTQSMWSPHGTLRLILEARSSTEERLCW